MDDANLFDDYYGYSHSDMHFDDFTPNYSTSHFRQSYNGLTGDNNVQLIKNGSNTVIQLSIGQLQQFMANSKPEPPSSQPDLCISSFESLTPTREDYHLSSKKGEDLFFDLPENDDFNEFKDIPSHPSGHKQSNTAKRAVGHHIIERRYRQNLNEKIANLKNLVMGTASKVSKGAILDEAASTIINLRNQVNHLNKQLRQMENGLAANKYSSTDGETSPEGSQYFQYSGLNFTDCGRFACCFFVFLIFLLNPFSYLLQSSSEVASSLSAFFNYASPLQTRSLLSHGHEMVGGGWLSFGIAVKSLLFYAMSHLLNVGCLFLFFVNFVALTLSSISKDALYEASLYLEKAKKCIQTGRVEEGERTIAQSLTCLGITTPSNHFFSLFKLLLSILYVTVAYIFGPILLKYRSFCRTLVLSTKDYNDFTEFMRLLSEVYLLQGVLILKRGVTNAHDDLRLLINGISAATLSGDSDLVVELYSLSALALRSHIIRPLTRHLLHRASCNAQSRSSKLFMTFVDRLYSGKSLDFGDYTSLADCKSIISLHYIDNQLVECLSSRHHSTISALNEVMDQVQEVCGHNLGELFGYRRSILNILVYRATHTKRNQPSISHIRPLSPMSDPIMSCVDLLLTIDSQIHSCGLSRLPSIIKLCKDANELLLSCYNSDVDHRLAKHFSIYVWDWMLTLRYDVLSYVECVAQPNSQDFSLFGNDFKDVAFYTSELDSKLLDRVAAFNRLWIQL